MKNTKKFVIIFQLSFILCSALSISAIEKPVNEIASGLLWFGLIYLVFGFLISKKLIELTIDFVPNQIIQWLASFFVLLLVLNLVSLAFDRNSVTLDMFKTNSVFEFRDSLKISRLIHLSFFISFIIGFCFDLLSTKESKER